MWVCSHVVCLYCLFFVSVYICATACSAMLSCKITTHILAKRRGRMFLKSWRALLVGMHHVSVLSVSLSPLYVFATDYSRGSPVILLVLAERRMVLFCRLEQFPQWTYIIIVWACSLYACHVHLCHWPRWHWRSLAKCGYKEVVHKPWKNF